DATVTFRCTSAKTAGRTNSVARVETASPPTTARPSGAVCSPPALRPIAIGTIPAIIAQLVISTGRSRLRPPPTAPRTESAKHPGALRERDQEDRVGHRHPEGHDRPHERLQVQRRAGCQERQPDSAEGRRDRRDRHQRHPPNPGGGIGCGGVGAKTPSPATTCHDRTLGTL